VTGSFSSGFRKGLARTWPLLLVFLAALGLRLIYLVQSTANPLFGVPVVDAASYEQWAERILHGRWFYDHVMIYTPVYPAFLALLKFMFGSGAWACKLTQSLMGACTALLISVITWRTWGRRAGLIAGLLAGTAWMGVIFDAESYSETFAIFFMCLSLFLAGSRKRGAITVLAAGLALGLSSGARVNLLLLVPAFLVWGFFRDIAFSRMKALRSAFLLCLGMVIILAPIAWRNYRMSGSFVLRVQGTWNFYSAMNPDFGGYYPPAGAKFNKYMLEPIQHGMKNDMEFERYWGDRARALISERPLDVARVFARRILIFLNAREWSQEFDVYAYRAYSSVLSLPFWPGFWLVAPLGIVGLFVLKKRRTYDGSLLAGCLILAVASVIFFKSSGRFRLPVSVIMAAFAGGLCARLWCYVEHRQWRRAGLIAVASAIPALFILPDWPGIAGNQSARHELFVGEHLWKAGRSDDALAMLEQATRKYSWDPDSPYLAAIICRSKGDPDAAMRYLDTALSREPVYPEAIILQGRILLQQGRPGEARDLAERATAMHPGSSDGWLLKADVCRSLKDTDGEEDAFSKAYRSGAWAGPLIAHALALEDEGAFDRALGWYEIVAGDGAFVAFNRARCCMLAGNLLARTFGPGGREKACAWWKRVPVEFGNEPFFAMQAAFLLGTISRDEYRREVKALNSRTADEFMEYNIGLRALLDNDAETAARQFRQVIGESAISTNSPASLPQKWARSELLKMN